MKQKSLNKEDKFIIIDTNHPTMDTLHIETIHPIKLLINKKLSKEIGKNTLNQEILHLDPNKVNKDHIPALQLIEQHQAENIQRSIASQRINFKA
jgi:hypothetical protein